MSQYATRPFSPETTSRPTTPELEARFPDLVKLVEESTRADLPRASHRPESSAQALHSRDPHVDRPLLHPTDPLRQLSPQPAEEDSEPKTLSLPPFKPLSHPSIREIWARFPNQPVKRVEDSTRAELSTSSHLPESSAQALHSENRIRGHPLFLGLDSTWSSPPPPPRPPPVEEDFEEEEPGPVSQLTPEAREHLDHYKDFDIVFTWPPPGSDPPDPPVGPHRSNPEASASSLSDQESRSPPLPVQGPLLSPAQTILSTPSSTGSQHFDPEAPTFVPSDQEDDRSTLPDLLNPAPIAEGQQLFDPEAPAFVPSDQEDNSSSLPDLFSPAPIAENQQLFNPEAPAFVPSDQEDNLFSLSSLLSPAPSAEGQQLFNPEAPTFVPFDQEDVPFDQEDDVPFDQEDVPFDQEDVPFDQEDHSAPSDSNLQLPSRLPPRWNLLGLSRPSLPTFRIPRPLMLAIRMLPLVTSSSALSGNGGASLCHKYIPGSSQIFSRPMGSASGRTRAAAFGWSISGE
ncbi:hypothetical protein N658DRAFT_165964 [Parathielavia hyrcaniae]|uniref:Uncharacterized protein n=1 Tax=Parathielavia hyrcaniae TaxID=113614 RepID=A0AAN6PWZ6_9PEZI|nr:hypothetical protein N658DRAFT_165964 [Parathielavia hyrcaniae]